MRLGSCRESDDPAFRNPCLGLGADLRLPAGAACDIEAERFGPLPASAWNSAAATLFRGRLLGIS